MSRTTIPLIVLDDITARYVANAQVSVFQPGGTVAAVVYTGSTGATVRAQPILSDVYGRVAGYLDRGTYQINIVIPGRPTRVEFYDSTPGADGAIDTPWIASAAVTSTKLAADAVTTPKVIDAAITTPKLADLSVTTPKIADASITSAKIANNAVVPATIPDNSITSQKLAVGISAGNRTLLRRSIGSFRISYQDTAHTFLSVEGQPNRPFNSRLRNYYNYYYDNYYHFYGLDTAEVPTPVTLNNVSSTVSVTVHTGGTVTNGGHYGGYYGYYGYYNPYSYYYPYYYYQQYNATPEGSDLSVKVILDGVPYEMIDTAIQNNVPNVNIYRPYAYYYNPGVYNNIFLSKTFTGLAPGNHTWNIKISKGSFEYYNDFVSTGYSLLTIQEEPSVV